MRHNALCEYRGTEGNYLLLYVIIIIISLYRILCTATLIMVTPPAALRRNSTHLIYFWMVCVLYYKLYQCNYKEVSQFIMSHTSSVFYLFALS